ncbi:FliM/FliN family flagellar motor switch protein [bacterium]|nr:FliM/FliN family flagellar motor switch protein [bacterium]
MTSNECNSMSTVESYLILEANRAISNLLGIRIHISPVIQETVNKRFSVINTGWNLDFKWNNMPGYLRIYIDSQGITEMLAIDKKYISSGDLNKILYQYALRFSEELSRGLTRSLIQPWKAELIEVTPFLKLDKAITSSKLFRIYELYTGDRFLLYAGVSVDNHLFRTWRNQWQQRFKPVVPVVSNPDPLSVQSHWQDSLEVEFPVSAELGKTNIQLKEILDLCPGDVLSLDKIEEDPVDLYMNSQKFAEGRIVRTNGRIGIQVTALICQEDRMRQLYKTGQTHEA